tara:strand:- start:16 stop:963 length:948 start_codon:yes stop_codon:yes gene_type:complete
MIDSPQSVGRYKSELKKTEKRRLELKGKFPNEWNKLPLTRKHAQTFNPVPIHYFTAKKCPHGHLERRFTTTGGCLACMSIHQKKVDKKVKEKRALEIISKSEFKTCPECGISFLMTPSDRKDKVFCSRKCASAPSKRNWLLENPEKRKQVANEYVRRQIDGKTEVYEKSKKRASKYKTERYRTDSVYALIHNYRSRLNSALKYQNADKSYTSLEFLGLDTVLFHQFIERQFNNKMSWDNHERDGWHLDHIRPCESFDLTDEEEVLVCFNWRNFRPLWSTENISKNNRYEKEDELNWSNRMRSLGYEGELFLLYIN